ncbi:MAG TPA: DivIVA domain-containing protein [Gaiellaceae bacterium]|nr:DivIVA domain-containing protein [Gaiellaceae bacterium]
MSYTPVELHHVRFRRTLFGYRPSAVERVLEEVADSFEAVWKERAELADRVEALEADVARHREVEDLLRTTLVSAERACQELREQASREAAAIVEEAHRAARGITSDARAERERLLLDAGRIRAILRSALDTVEDASTDLLERSHGDTAGHAEAA